MDNTRKVCGRSLSATWGSCHSAWSTPCQELPPSSPNEGGAFGGPLPFLLFFSFSSLLFLSPPPSKIALWAVVFFWDVSTHTHTHTKPRKGARNRIELWLKVLFTSDSKDQLYIKIASVMIHLNSYVAEPDVCVQKRWKEDVWHESLGNCVAFPRLWLVTSSCFVPFDVSMQTNSKFEAAWRWPCTSPVFSLQILELRQKLTKMHMLQVRRSLHRADYCFGKAKGLRSHWQACRWRSLLQSLGRYFLSLSQSRTDRSCAC